MSLEAVASWILRFAKQQPFQARSAYSAFLLIPGWEQLRFCTAIRQAKKFWETSGEKYGDFWDAEKVVLKLASTPCDWSCVRAVRDRAILCLRLFHLCRSVDLARAERSHSKLGSQVYWKLQRKGQKSPKWEALMTVENPLLSPVHLLQRYVQLTATQGHPGGPVFLSLTPPFQPLSANSIGRITRTLLCQLGVPVSVFGPHSTRGAGVRMFKNLGLASEVVCELGAWKNTEAFAKHYLRIGAAQVAGSVLSQKLVHSVPSWRSDEKGGSSSPGTGRDPGRRDPPCEARDEMGPVFARRPCCLLNGVSWRRPSSYCSSGSGSLRGR